ncbi:MAG: acylphosphatase [Candidatus Margulisbacteria bacterium]|nr:acylphosphatase [Candidatus Margulisiibacteriota bacterium]
MAEKRMDALFSGSVQGVGFRFTAERFANDYGVKGYVRNTPNGKVELVAEGDEKILKKLLNAIVEDMGNVIDNYSADWFPPTGEFERFEIRAY